MKNTLFIVLMLAAFGGNAFAQETSKPAGKPQLLSLYYNIKDALVEGKAAVASVEAQAFAEALSSTDNKTINESSLSALKKDAANISATKNIEKQREYFGTLSTDMIAIAKQLKVGDQRIYEQYCPMKKAYWLSSERAIKNPYYGDSMLTCGQVTEAL